MTVSVCAGSAGALDEWISEFRDRHATELGPAGLVTARAAAEMTARRPPERWYRSVRAALAERAPVADSSAPFSDPRRVLYLGEVNLRLDRRTASVAELRQSPPAGRSAEADNVAYVQALSASGERAPPMLVRPAGELVRDDLAGDACFRQTTRSGGWTPGAACGRSAGLIRADWPSL